MHIPQLVSRENPCLSVDVEELTTGADGDVTGKGTDEVLTELVDQWCLGTS